MAISDKIISLIDAHYKKDNELFYTVSLQIAAQEAKAGHTIVANSIKDIANQGRVNTNHLPIVQFMNSAMGDMIMRVNDRVTIDEIIVSNENKGRIERVILEYRERRRLQRHGLQNRNKILLGGPSGTGKTMTASVIATETDLPLYLIRTDRVITKYMGASSANLGQVFDIIDKNEGVYLFDEFDAIGSDRTRDNEVGEMRRILTSFLMFMERTATESIIVAATNHTEMLDNALFRRFDDVIHFALPSAQQIQQLLNLKLADRLSATEYKTVADKFIGLSHAEICNICNDAIKETIMSDKNISAEMLINIQKEKQQKYSIA